MPNFFVYGALMSKYTDKSSTKIAFLPDHRISFIVKGNSWFEPAFATLEYAKGHVAWGTVIKLSEEEWIRYSQHEVRHYNAKEISVYSSSKETINCIALVAKDLYITKEAQPSKRYANLLYRGAIYHGLPKSVIDQYIYLMKTGNPWTLRLQFLFPLARMFVPLVGREKAFVACLQFLGFLILLLILLILIIIWK